MAVNIDTVYQRVLAILNKEQRGFLSPIRYNLFANQVQLELYESYFYDLEYFLNLPGNSTKHADMVEMLETKISLFETSDPAPTYAAPYFLYPSDYYRMSAVLYNGQEIDRLSRRQYNRVQKTSVGVASDTFPVYIEEDGGVTVYGDAQFTDASPVVNPVEFLYVRKPVEVEWASTNVMGEAQYNAGNSTNFELHPSDETDLVIGILKLAGVEVRDLSIYEIANQQDITEMQLEKQ